MQPKAKEPPPADPKGRKFAAYIRVSTSGQVADGYGLDIQRKEIQAWAKRHGARIVEWFSDEGISGSKGEDGRPGLTSALEAICSGRASGLVVGKLDRLARKLHIQEAALGHVWECNGDVWSVEQGRIDRDDPDDPMRTAMRKMAGVFAELDRDMIEMRLRKGRLHKRDQGGHAYGKPPFGWRAPSTKEERQAGVLIEDPKEQAILAQMHKLRENGGPGGRGLSYREIADSMNAGGIPTRQGSKWSPNTVRRILTRLTPVR